MFRTLALLLGFWAVVGAQAPRPWLGVGLVDVPPDMARDLGLNEGSGAAIAQVVPGSPADRAGMRKEEVIVRFNDQPVSSVHQVGALVRQSVAGQLIPVVLVSTTGRRTVEVRIEELKPSSPPRPPEPPRISAVEPLDFDLPRPVMVVRNRSLGATLEPIEGQLADYFGVKSGLLVRDVRQGSAAEQAGLRAGDVVVEANQQEVRHPDHLRRALNQRAGESAELRVVRDRRTRTLTLRLEAGDPFGRPFSQRVLPR